MKDHHGISGTICGVLSMNNVNILAIAQGASERFIAIIIKEKDTKNDTTTVQEKGYTDSRGDG